MTPLVADSASSPEIALASKRSGQSQGKTSVAHALISPIYEGVTEGFETQDLLAAESALTQN